MSEDETCYTLYGSASGDWCMLVSPKGFLPPARLGHLRYMTDPSGAFTGLANGLKDSAGPRFPAQQALARLVGVSQQEISRYISGQVQPRLSDHATWRRIAAALFAWTEWPDKPTDAEAVRAFIAECTEAVAVPVPSGGEV